MRVQTILLMAVGAALGLGAALLVVDKQVVPWVDQMAVEQAGAEARLAALRVERAFEAAKQRLESAARSVAASEMLALRVAQAGTEASDAQLGRYLEQVSQELGPKTDASLLDENGGVIVGDPLLGSSPAARDCATTKGASFRTEAAEGGTKMAFAVPIQSARGRFVGIVVLSQLLQSARASTWLGMTPSVRQFALLEASEPVLSVANQGLVRTALQERSDDLAFNGLRYAVAEREISEADRKLVVLTFARVKDSMGFRAALQWLLGALSATCFLVGLVAVLFIPTHSVSPLSQASTPPSRISSASWLPAVSTASSPTLIPDRGRDPTGSDSAMNPLAAPSRQSSTSSGAGWGSFGTYGGTIQREVDRLPAPTADVDALSPASADKVPPPPSADASLDPLRPVASASRPPDSAYPGSPRAPPAQRGASNVHPPDFGAAEDHDRARRSEPAPGTSSTGIAPAPRSFSASTDDLVGLRPSTRASSEAQPPLSPVDTLPSGTPLRRPMPASEGTDRHTVPSPPSFDAIAAAARAVPAAGADAHGSAERNLPVPKGGLSPGMVAGQGLVDREGIMAPSPRLEDNLPIPKEQAPHLYDLAPRREASSPALGSSVSPFDEVHYRRVYDDFLAAKEEVGLTTEGFDFDGFLGRLRAEEQELIRKHECKAVRFQVLVKDNDVSLRPHLVR